MRPFNKWLRFDLEREPLRMNGLVDLVGLVERIVAAPTPEHLRMAFIRIEAAARAAGLGATVDGWEPDVAWLRGEALDSA